MLFILILSISNNIAFASDSTLPTAETIQAKDFHCLLGKLNGISDCLLKQHFELYHGYIKSLNTINSKLKKSLTKGSAAYSEYRALNIAKPFANNGVILHELYFENLAEKQTRPSEILLSYINRDFGSYESYICDIKEAAKSARSGWVITGYNLRDCKLHNYIIDLHDEHVPIYVVPIMVMDVWEHSFAVDYGINKDAYIEVFLKNLDWDTVSCRIKIAAKR